MAGDIKRQRKSWTLQDRSKVSINILRANLAEEGDEDAQLDVAKRLLQESSDIDVPSRSSQENARLALYWLIKSSEQGNDEATQLLKECLQTGNGLTAQNILDVRTCITTPKYEKLTFKAARLIHRKLSNGEEFITTAQLLARMNAKGRGRNAGLFEGCYPNGGVIQEEACPEEENAEEMLEERENVHREKEKNAMNAALAQDDFMKDADVDLNETFTVPNDVHARSAASSSTPSNSPKQKLNGSFENPSRMVSNELPVSVSQLDLQFAMMQSGKKLMLSDLLTVAKDFNAGKTPQISVNECNKTLLRHQWNVNSFPNVFIAQLLTLAVLGNLIHLGNAVVYLIFLGIIWSCYNCLLWKLRYNNFKDWTLAFESVLVGEWETDKMQLRLSLQYMIPYVIIFSLGLLIMPTITEDPIAILLTGAGIMVIISIQYGLRQKLLPSWQNSLLLSTTLVYYQLPFIINLMGEDFEKQISLLLHPIFQLGDSNQFPYLRLSIDAFTLFICALLSTTAKLSIKDIINETIPDIVLSLWLIKVVHMSVTVKCSYVLPAISLGVVLSVVMMLLCSRLELWKVALVILSGVILIVVPALLATSAYQEFLGSHEEGMETGDISFVEWENYEVSCHRKAWSLQSPAATQIKCSSMYGDHNSNMLVKWKGRISIVKIEKLSRSPKDLKSLEDVVFDISVGIFPSHKDGGSQNWQNFLSGSSDTQVIAPASLIVKASDIRNSKEKQDLVDHILNFRVGDRIEFVGKLKGSTAGSLKPQIIDVRSIQCLSCTTADYGEFVIDHNDRKLFTLSWLKSAILGIPFQVNSSDIFEQTKGYLAYMFSSVQNFINTSV